MDHALVSTIAEDLRAHANSFQNPSLLSQDKVSFAFSLLKWGAILVATVACFTTLITRVRFFIIQFHRKSSPILQPLLGNFDDADDFSDEETSSQASSSDYDDDRSEEEPEKHVSPSYRRDFTVSGWNRFELRDGGSSGLRRRRSFAENLSQLYSGRNVVKLWDNIGSKFKSISQADCANVDFQAIAATSPRVIVSAGLNNVRNIALNVWDTRIGFRVPTILAEWVPETGSVLTVGDVRNVSRPLAESEMELERWWDADAVMDSVEFAD